MFILFLKTGFKCYIWYSNTYFKVKIFPSDTNFEYEIHIYWLFKTKLHTEIYTYIYSNFWKINYLIMEFCSSTILFIYMYTIYIVIINSGATKREIDFPKKAEKKKVKKNNILHQHKNPGSTSDYITVIFLVNTALHSLSYCI